MSTTSMMSLQQPFNPNLITPEISLSDFHGLLRTRGCSGCELGLQEHLVAPVISRGNPLSGRMIIGEAPGMSEDIEGLPFVGPAGQKEDEILKSQGWDPNQDFYWTNICLCRPIAPPGVFKQNQTPKASHRDACLPFIQYQIEKINPYVVLILGATAAHTLIGEHTRGKKMSEIAGRTYLSTHFSKQVFFIMHHPAALLHAQKAGPEAVDKLKKTIWQHIQTFKQLDTELRSKRWPN